MILMRRIAIALLLLFVFVIFWIWWTRPTRADMAAYAPADSLVYLEANSIVDIGRGIASTDAWQKLGPHLQLQQQLPSPWFSKFVMWTGLGSVETVVTTRAQVAVVMLNVGATEEGETTLKVKPDAAIIVETHTPSWRTKPAVEKFIGNFARTAYGTPTLTRQTVNDAELLIWSAPTGSRQIIAATEGSLVVIGNSDLAVRACLAVKHGERPSLKDAPELRAMRQKLNAERALAFGYVSSANAGKLVSIATPLLMGSGRSEIPMETILTEAATKLLGSIGWSSIAANGGIEDRYLFNIKEPASSRLTGLFHPTTAKNQFINPLIPNSYSITEYSFESPVVAWQGFESALLSQMDALSAVVFKSVWKSALNNYGVEEPEAFLKLVGPQLATVRLRPAAERSVLVASITDYEQVKSLIRARLGSRLSQESVGPFEFVNAVDKELSAAISERLLLLGPPDDVRSCTTNLANAPNPGKLNAYKPSLASATIVTYTNDSDRIRTFMNAVAQAVNYQRSQSNPETLEQFLSQVPYSVTETALNSEGIQRRTQSSFGQFSTIFSLLFPSS
jgi:hypothetical protein